jgi:hypothetical protein
MTIVVGARHALAGLFVFALAALAGGTLIAPAASEAVTTTAYTRSASCAGLSFYPTDSDATYANDGTLRFRNTQDGTGVFRCDPGLPNGAVVSMVQFTLLDNSSPGGLSNCGLVRSGLTTTTATSYQSLATVPDTSEDAKPGIVRLSDSSIQFGTVDNTKFGYWLECQIYALSLGPSVGIYGADVVYTITAAKG